jgi:hypothetical protein
MIAGGKTWTSTWITLLAAACFVSAALADGGDLLWRAPGIENIVCLEWIEDIDGDGLPDVIFETYGVPAPRPTTSTRFAGPPAAWGT